ncbi:acetylglutamate kinase [Peribacillus sp. SCS-155]|uniref:acetylglutamate kinase n=1 Tax=Peribacillus sedimenti TaxID=3115297 RepID=UPI0039062BDE
MKILVIKCGGSIMENLSPSFFKSIKELQAKEYRLVFVHGGGSDINNMLSQYGIEPVFVDGLRKTTAEVLAVVELMLAGKSNRSLVHKLEMNGVRAIGLNGSDGILQGNFIDETKLGAVGEVSNVNTNLLKLVLDQGISPVLTPIAITDTGNKLNVNADMAAGAVAKALGAEMCLFVTDVKGVLKEKKILEQLTARETSEMIESGDIYGGMIPKVETALSVLQKGTKEVMIVSGKDTFYENERFLGTRFVREEAIYQ